MSTDRPTVTLKWIVLAAFGLILTISGCAKRKFNTGEVKHQAGQPVFDRERFNWRDSSLEEFRKGSFMFIPHEDFVASRESELFKVINEWLGRVHEAALKSFPKELENVPRPFAAVVAYPQVNASVLVDAYCWNFTAAFAESKMGPIAETPVLGLKDGVIDTTSSGTRCVDPDVSRIERDQYFKWLSARMAPCEIKYEPSSKTIQLGAACESKVSRTTVGRTFHTPVMLNAIVMNTQSILNFETFEHFAAIISHELAHYYRAHGVIAAKDFNFFYDIRATPKTARPVPSSDTRVIDIENRLQTLSGPQFVYLKPEGSEREVASLIMWSDVLNSGPARSALKDLDACRAPLGAAQSVAPLLKKYLETDECCNGKEFSLIAAFSADVMACGKVIKLDSKFKNTPVRDAFKRGLREARIVLDDVFTDTSDKTAADLTARLEGTLLKQREEVDLVVREGIAANAGFYTIEQEADEMGAELLAMMGHQPSVHTIPAWFGFLGKGTSKAKFDPLDGMVRNCEAALKADWKAPIGGDAALFVPFIGPLRRLHHANCYRIYNIDQELKAHRYVENPNKLVPSKPWTDLRNLARKFQVETIAKHGDPSAFD